MNRLTKRLNGGKELCIDVCGEQCVDGYTWCPKCKPFSDVMKKLADYEDAEEHGLFLRLPVPEGTTVYQLIKVVNYGEVGDKGEFKYYHRKTTFCRNMIEEFGETVFLTEGQAAQKIHDIEEKQALAKMKEV